MAVLRAWGQHAPSSGVHSMPDATLPGAPCSSPRAAGTCAPCVRTLLRLLAADADAQSTCGLVAMTSAPHAEGRQLDPGQV